MTNSAGTPPELPPNQRDGCLTAFMVAAGLVLLFPGLCVLLLSGGQLAQRDIFSQLGLLILGIFLGGIGLIAWAVLRPGR